MPSLEVSVVESSFKSKYIFSLLPVVLFINLDSFGVSCPVLETSAVEISVFSVI